MTRGPRIGVAGLSTTPDEKGGASAAAGRIGVLTYVLSYDDLGRDDAFRLPRLGADGFELRIGRAASGEATRAERNEVRIRDPLVSRAHAKVHCVGTSDVITDLGSKHGTFVNGERIKSHALQDGDCVEVGHSLLVYRSVDAPTARLIAERGAPMLGPTRTLSPRLVRMLDDIERIAQTRLSVLLLGETGTGKEVVAEVIHARSGRPGSLLTIHCAALSPSLVEGELFGHEKGAYTGSDQARRGLLRSVDGGTVLLDEIGEVPDAVQVKLLRVLQQGEVKPVGSDRTQRVDLRAIAATNADVRGPSARLRPDLLARIGQVVLELPPLRERREDLGTLAAYFLARCEEEEGRPVPRAIDRHAGRRLFCGALALNVRGLRDALRRGALVARGERIELADLGPLAEDDGEDEAEEAETGEGTAAPPSGRTRHKRPDRAQIVALRERHPTDAAVAAALEVHEKQLRRWLDHYALPSRRRPAK